MGWYGSNHDFGKYCHWCGEPVPDDGHVKRGKHIFCRNGGKCKMAHARAYAAYEKRCRRVTAGDIPGMARGSSPGRKGNARRSVATPTSSGAIRIPRSAKSNARKPGYDACSSKAICVSRALRKGKP